MLPERVHAEIVTCEPKLSIVRGYPDDGTWEGFPVPNLGMEASKNQIFDAVRGVLKAAMEHFAVADLSELEMVEFVDGRRVFLPRDRDGNVGTNHVICIRKKRADA